MKLSHLNLSTRIILATLLLIMAGGVLWVVNQNQRLHEVYVRERRADIESALNLEKTRVGVSLETLRQDTVFLANTPPISGLLRARAHHGVDPRDKNTTATWEARLQDIFVAFLRAHPDYSCVHYLGLADGGRDWVRVEQQGGRIHITPPAALQAQGESPSFKAGLTLRAGQVHLSQFTQEQDEPNATQVPPVLVLRAVTPVFDSRGHLFGMIVLHLNVRRLLTNLSAGLPLGVRTYVTNQQGYYLSQHDGQRTDMLTLGSSHKISDDFPLLTPLLSPSTEPYFALQAIDRGAGGYIAARRIFFDANQPPRFLLLAYHIPAQVVSQQITNVTLPSIIYVMLVVALLSAAFVLILRHAFAPLKHITLAAHEIAAGNQSLRLNEMEGGEIGKLVAALNIMLDKLSDRELLHQERDFRKSILDSTHDGYWLLDVHGNILEANQAYADISGYTVAQLVAMHVSQLEVRELSTDEVRTHLVKTIAQGFDLFETCHRHQDGHEINIEISATFMPKTEQFVVFSRDITARKQIEKVLQESQKHILAVLDELRYQKFALDQHAIVATTDVRGTITYVNEKFSEISGYSSQELIGQNHRLINSGTHAQAFFREMFRTIAAGKVWHGEICNRTKQGELYWVLTTIVPYINAKGKPIQYIAIRTDITAHKHAEKALRIAATAFESHDGMMVTDAAGTIIRVNRAFQNITGYAAAEVLGQNPRILSSGRQDQAFYVEMWRQLLHNGTWSGEIWDKRKNGQIYPKWLTITAVKDDTGKTTEYVAIFSDITARKQAEDEIRNLAFYDVLTRLPNRRLLMDRLTAALAISVRSLKYGAVLFLDMDKFKILNDTLGHDYGDLMLIEVAERVQSCVRDSDTVARLGGDEFVVLLAEIDENDQETAHKVALIAEKIRLALSQPYQLKDHLYHSSPSIGVSVYRGREMSVDTLIKHADMAMYQAKEAGRNAVRFFDPAMLLVAV